MTAKLVEATSGKPIRKFSWYRKSIANGVEKSFQRAMDIAGVPHQDRIHPQHVKYIDGTEIITGVLNTGAKDVIAPVTHFIAEYIPRRRKKDYYVVIVTSTRGKRRIIRGITDSVPQV